MSTSHYDQLLTPTKAARILGVHRNTLGNWAAAGVVPHLRLPNGQRRYRLIDILRLRDSMHQPARTREPFLARPEQEPSA